MVAISVLSVNHEGFMATFAVSGLSTSHGYDVMRVVEPDPGNEMLPPTRDDERKYQVVGHRRNWVPGASSIKIRDYEASLRPYRLAVYDSAQTTPADWDFAYGGYGGPGPLAVSDVVTITPPECGALLRSTVQPAFWVPVKVADVQQLTYPARAAQHKIIGSRFPVFINDRREGRHIDRITLYTSTLTDAYDLHNLLIPETGRIYPLWLRTSDADRMLLADLCFMPQDIEVEPVSKSEPWRKWFHLEVTEIDTRSLVPRRGNDGSTADPPNAVITGGPLKGKAPLRVNLNGNSSTGTISSWRWDFNTAGSAYGTSTKANPPEVTYRKRGTYTVKLTVDGPLGADVTTRKVVVL